MRLFVCLALCATALAQSVAAASAAGRAAPAPDAFDVTGPLEVATASSPRVRLEQDDSLGRMPYIWDFGGDDREFYVADLTGGSIPFRLSAGYLHGGLFIEEPTGDWGVMGDARAPLEIWNTHDGTPRQLLVEEASSVSQARNLVRFVNNGPSLYAFQAPFPQPDWFFGSQTSGAFVLVSKQDNVTTAAMTLTPAGDVTLSGTLTQLSDHASKQDVLPVDGSALLERLAVLPLSTWRYGGRDARHVGPMAQDFAAAFGLGADGEHIAPSDLAGVGLAAVRALNAAARALETRAAAAESRLERHERNTRDAQARLERLERGRE